MFFSNNTVTIHIPDEFWQESLEMQLEVQLDTFVKFRDQIDRGRFLTDFVKALVSFGIRNIDSPLFKAKVEHVLMAMVEDLDAQTTENLLFYLPTRGEIRNGPLVKKIVEHIEEKEWVTQGLIQDVIHIIRLLNEHANFFRPKSLWDQIEAISILQCFSDESKANVPHEALQDIICIYAFEFSRSKSEFSEFYKRFLAYINENTDLVASELSLINISHVTIAYASLGLTDSSYKEFWDNVRIGACNQLLHDKEELLSNKPIEMILGALFLVDGLDGQHGTRQEEATRELNS